MADTDEPKPQETEGQTDSDEEEEESEEGGLPSWVSWGLVVVAAVFGGYLLGYQGRSPTAPSDGAKQLLNTQQIAMMKQEHERAIERAKRTTDEYMRAFCREMIRTGLFRDGLDKALAALKDDVGKVLAELGKSGAKPEDRIAKATDQLKKADEKLGKIAKFYSRQTLAAEKVGRIGTMEGHFAYFYLVRIRDLMAKAKQGDQKALAEARSCRRNIGQLDPVLAANLDKSFPELAPRATQAATTAPAKQAAP